MKPYETMYQYLQALIKAHQMKDSVIQGLTYHRNRIEDEITSMRSRVQQKEKLNNPPSENDLVFHKEIKQEAMELINKRDEIDRELLNILK